MAPIGECIDDETAVSFIEGLLAELEVLRVESHIDGCASCRKHLVGMVRARGSATQHAPESPTPSLPAGPGGDLPPGTVLARYVVLEKLGQGGMGVVYAAFDPKLDRKIALKLVRDRDAGKATNRLEREAQALARLTHDNVVTVHDVGAVDGQVFIAMEFVSGTTVGEWLRSDKRTWREVLAIYLRAGRGLVAAHAAGLVHRDFKPDNVMIATSGRVVVMDFGIAKLATSDTTTLDLDTLPEVARTAAVEQPQMTLTGALLGTPLYMAPEQHRGQPPPDARTDQFCFCVALYEGIYGERPFAGRTWAEIAFAVFEGKVENAPRGTAVPTWVRRVLLRGLATDPADRFPSMDALLAALERDPARARRRWGVAGGLAAAVAAVAAVVTYGAFGDRHQETDPCDEGEARLRAVWDPDRRAAIRKAFLATGTSFAEATWLSTERALDRFGKRWSGAYRSVCEATWVRHDQSAQLLDARMSCLDDYRRHLGTLTTLLAKVDAKGVDRALATVEDLPAPEVCVTIAKAGAPVGPALKQQVNAIRDKLDEVKALHDLGKDSEAALAAKAIDEEARAVDHAPIRAWALYTLAKLKVDTGDKEAEAALLDALVAAEETGEDLLAFQAWRTLIYLVGYEKGRITEGRLYARLAAAAYLRAGKPPGEESSLPRYVGILHLAASEHEQAIAEFRRAIELYEREPHADKSTSPEVAQDLNNLGVALTESGRDDEALAAYNEAIAIRERLQGKDHPTIATALSNVARIHVKHGRYHEAEALDLRAFEIRKNAFGPDSPMLASIHSHLGIDALSLGRPEDALARFEKAVAIAEKAGFAGPKLATYVNNVAAVNLTLGRADQARAGFERAIALELAAKDAKPSSVAKERSSLCSALSRQGHHREALAQCASALEAARKGLRPDHEDLPQIETAYGAALVAAGKPTEALPLLEQALRRREDTKGEPTDLAETRFAVAQALQALRRDPSRARTLAMQAHETFAPVGRTYPDLLARIEAWLAKAPRR